MSNNIYMPISEFARITCIKRANLIFYDKIGLLCPEYRKENGYRYYTRNQLASAFLIASLREIGISIKEIKEYASIRTPKKMLTLFETQEKKIQEEIDKLQRMKWSMKLYGDMAKDALQIDLQQIHIVKKEEEPIFIGTKIQPDEILEEASIGFYDYATANSIELSYPLGVITTKEKLLSNQIEQIDCFYLRCPNPSTSLKPAGTYIVGYIQGDYGESIALYHRMLQYIQEHNLTISGDAYEEYLLSEVSTQDPAEYLTRVEIQIQIQIQPQPQPNP